ncbi:hypothetical protein BaRGS_00008120 [Batillaria attramentaria]|uniref:Uncharacterized protein n=1 Tax=Batillaria attramentaria TaxID=370345 RepID=A0ABD0LM75_9CAEN
MPQIKLLTENANPATHLQESKIRCHNVNLEIDLQAEWKVVGDLIAIRAPRTIHTSGDHGCVGPSEIKTSIKMEEIVSFPSEVDGESANK